MRSLKAVLVTVDARKSCILWRIFLCGCTFLLRKDANLGILKLIEIVGCDGI